MSRAAHQTTTSCRASRTASAARLPRSLYWRAPLACAALLWALVLVGDDLVRAALPAAAWLVGELVPEFDVLSVALERSAHDRLVMMKVSVTGTVVLGGQALVPAPGSVAQASTLAWQCLHGPALAAWVALAWPTGGGPGGGGVKPTVQSPNADWPRILRSSLHRACLVGVLSAALMLLDLSLVLAGAAWQTLVDSVAPGERSALLMCKDFMGQGGRLALGLSSGGVAVLLTRLKGP